jgi:hypothetical protein
MNLQHWKEMHVALKTINHGFTPTNIGFTLTRKSFTLTNKGYIYSSYCGFFIFATERWCVLGEVIKNGMLIMSFW